MIITKEIIENTNNLDDEKLKITITPENQEEKTALQEHIETLKKDFEKTLDNLYKPVTIEEAIKEATL